MCVLHLFRIVFLCFCYTRLHHRISTKFFFVSFPDVYFTMQIEYRSHKFQEIDCNFLCILLIFFFFLSFFLFSVFFSLWSCVVSLSITVANALTTGCTFVFHSLPFDRVWFDFALVCFLVVLFFFFVPCLCTKLAKRIIRMHGGWFLQLIFDDKSHKSPQKCDSTELKPYELVGIRCFC